MWKFKMWKHSQFLPTLRLTGVFDKIEGQQKDNLAQNQA